MTSKLKKLAMEVVKYNSEWDDDLAIAINNLEKYLNNQKAKLTIDLNKTEQGYNKQKDQPYLWTIIDEGGKDMYEVQIFRLNFPSTRKDIRSGDGVGAKCLQITNDLSHSGQRVSEYYYDKTY
tara:strand:+ start:73 stop:441 length:369 start_codon:yes stop_codon:yes gene_type:complete